MQSEFFCLINAGFFIFENFIRQKLALDCYFCLRNLIYGTKFASSAEYMSYKNSFQDKTLLKTFLFVF